MEKIIFKYDPLVLTRLGLQIYLEKTYDRNDEYPKSVRFALVEFMRTMDDEELENLLEEYVTTDQIEAITLDGDDFPRITHFLMQGARYNDLVYEKQKKGTDGLGVIDQSDKTFYPCSFAHHWETIGYILREKYGNYGQAFDKIMYGGHDEYKGVSRQELDNLILTNFILIGESKRMEDQLADLNRG